jgi:hypothetical protein
MTVLKHVQFFTDPFAAFSPYTTDAVNVLLASGTVPKREGNGGPIPRMGSAMDAGPQEILIYVVGTLDARSTRSIQYELNGIQYRGLSASIDPTNENNWTSCAIVPARSEVETLFIPKEAEIAE